MVSSFKRRLIFRLLSWFVGICICLYLLPFVYLITLKPDSRSRLGEQLIYHLIIGDVLKPSFSAERKVLSVMQYVNSHIRNPTLSEKANDVSRLQILESGIGYCDQQVNVFLALCETAGISGRMVWLYGEDSVSAHTVAEVYYDGKFHMIDPFYKQVFYLSNHEIASVNDVIQGNIDPNDFEKMSNKQKRLYGKKYPWKIAPRTPVSQSKSMGSKLVFLYSDFMGPVFYGPWLSLCTHYSGIPVPMH
jgi:hypothetical protein